MEDSLVTRGEHVHQALVDFRLPSSEIKTCGKIYQVYQIFVNGSHLKASFTRTSTSPYLANRFTNTKMHSSRMRTVRSSGRISGGDGLLAGRGLLARGCPWWGDLIAGGLLTGGLPARGSPCPGVLLPGGSPCQGVSLLGGLLAGGPPCQGGLLVRGSPCLGSVPGQVLPPCGQTDTCKNITFTTSLQTVKIETAVLTLIVPAKFCQFFVVCLV